MSVSRQRLPRPDPQYGSILSEAHGRLNTALLLLREIEAHARTGLPLAESWSEDWFGYFIAEASNTQDKLYALMRLDETILDE